MPVVKPVPVVFGSPAAAQLPQTKELRGYGESLKLPPGGAMPEPQVAGVMYSARLCLLVLVTSAVLVGA